jgi:peroxiredoxin
MRRRFQQKAVHHLFKAILLWHKQVFFLFVSAKASEVMGKPQFRFSKQAQTVHNLQVLTSSSFCLVSVLQRRFCGDNETLFILVFVSCFRENFTEKEMKVFLNEIYEFDRKSSIKFHARKAFIPDQN